jgi:hypothetical protein
MSPADHCCVIEHLDSSPLPHSTLEEILTSEGLRSEVVSALVGLFRDLPDRLAYAAAESSMGVDEVCAALDDMDIEDVVAVLEYGAQILKAATPPASALNPGEADITPA